MKNSIFITLLSFGICLLSACGGDHMAQSGKGDTVKSTYPPTVDSSKFDKDTGRNVPGMHGKALKKDSTKK
ncbi:MAG: hypothetical protein ABJA76_06545 [Mucilaginibacter sp.]